MLQQQYSEIITKINEAIERMKQLELEAQEKELAYLIERYDFLVGSIECRHMLEQILPDGANIICSKYIVEPMTIYAIQKIDLRDYLLGDFRVE